MCQIILFSRSPVNPKLDTIYVPVNQIYWLIFAIEGKNPQIRLKKRVFFALTGKYIYVPDNAFFAFNR